MSTLPSTHRRRKWPEHQVLLGLVLAAQRNEARALDAVLAMLRPSVVAFFARRIAQDAAEDLTQTALIRIARAVEGMDADRASEHVAMVVRTLMQREQLRKSRGARRSAPAELGERVASPVDLERQIEYKELVRAVHRASVAILPPDIRRVVFGLLRGLGHGEIAAELGVTTAMVRTRLFRARVLLRHELHAYLDGTRPAHRGPRRRGARC